MSTRSNYAAAEPRAPVVALPPAERASVSKPEIGEREPNVRAIDRHFTVRLRDDAGSRAATLRYSVTLLFEPASRDARAEQHKKQLLALAVETLRVHARLQATNSFFATPVFASAVERRRPQHPGALDDLSSSSSAAAVTYVSSISLDASPSLGDLFRAQRAADSALSARQLVSLAFQLVALKLELRQHESTAAAHLAQFTPAHLALRRVAPRPTVLELRHGTTRWLLTSGRSPFKDLRYADQRAEDIAFHSDGFIHFNVAETLRLAHAQPSEPRARSKTTFAGLVDESVGDETAVASLYPYHMSLEELMSFFVDGATLERTANDARHFWEIGCTLVDAATTHYAPPEYLPPSNAREIDNLWSLMPLERVYTQLIPLYRDLLEAYAEPKRRFSRYAHLRLAVPKTVIAGELGGDVEPSRDTLRFVALANHLVFTLLFERALGNDTSLVHARIGALLTRHAALIDEFALRSYYRSDALVARYRESRQEAARQERRDESLPPLYVDRGSALQRAPPSFYTPFVEAVAWKLGDHGMQILRNFLSLRPDERGRMSFDDDDNDDELVSLLRHPYFRAHQLSLETFTQKYIVPLTPSMKPLTTFYVRRYTIGGGDVTDDDVVPTRDLLKLDTATLSRRVDERVERLYASTPLAAGDDEVLRVYEALASV